MRRKGVELKLHLGDAPPEIDQTLVRNIIKARRWLAMIVEGRTFSEIAETEGISKRRVQDVVDLAMLAPDVLDAIAAGEQPDGLTTDYLIKSGFRLTGQGRIRTYDTRYQKPLPYHLATPDLRRGILTCFMRWDLQ